jgi:hypothetical protein
MTARLSDGAALEVSLEGTRLAFDERFRLSDESVRLTDHRRGL